MKIPRTMYAVVTTGNGGYEKLVYQQVPIPRPAPGEVLLQVLAAGVNNTDINTRLGWYSKMVTTGTDSQTALEEENLNHKEDGGWQGTDCCGRVVSVTAGVDPSLLGRRVLVRSCMRGPKGFCYEPSMDAQTMAAVFCDYNGQYRYVPGMPVTRVLNRDGKLCRVYHRINPITFIAPSAQKIWPAWLYNFLTYSYQLDEEVFFNQGEAGPGYSVRWTIPLETQVLGARENGEILFATFGQGTLITYNNATEPFGYRRLKAILPKRWLARFYLCLGRIARNYYQRTVEAFVDVATKLNPAELNQDVASMRSILAVEPIWSAGPSVVCGEKNR